MICDCEYKYCVYYEKNIIFTTEKFYTNNITYLLNSK